MTVFQYLSEIAYQGYSFEITAGLEENISVAVFDHKGHADGFEISKEVLYGGDHYEGFIKARITSAVNRLKKYSQ